MIQKVLPLLRWAISLCVEPNVWELNFHHIPFTYYYYYWYYNDIIIATIIIVITTITNAVNFTTIITTINTNTGFVNYFPQHTASRLHLSISKKYFKLRYTSDLA